MLRRRLLVAVVVGLLGIGAAGWAVSQPDLPHFTRTVTFTLPGGRSGWATSVGVNFQVGAVGGGRLFGCSQGGLAAFDQATGRREWQIPTSDDSPNADEDTCWPTSEQQQLLRPVGDRLLYETADGTLAAVDAATGAPRWMVRGVYAAEWTVSGTAVYTRSNASLVALDAETGTSRWSTPLPIDRQAPVYVLGATGSTVVAFAVNTLYGLSEADGHLLWSRQLADSTPTPTPSPYFHITAVTDGTRMAISYAGSAAHLVLVDPLSGQLTPVVTEAPFIAAFLALSGGRVLMWTGESGPSQILDLRSGRVGPGPQLPSLFRPISDGTLLYDDVAVGNSDDDALSAVDPNTGAVVWQGKPNGFDYWEAPLAASNGILYVGRNGEVCAIDAATGASEPEQSTT